MHRWNWGLIVEQTPYPSASSRRASPLIPISAPRSSSKAAHTQINRGITGITQYPFSRAQRVEFSGGIRRISFDYEVESFFFGFPSGVFLGRTRKTSSGRMRTSVKQARRSSTTRLSLARPADPWTALSFRYRKPPAH